MYFLCYALIQVRRYIFFLTNFMTSFFAVIMYVLLPMPLLFFAGSDSSSLYSDSNDRFDFCLCNPFDKCF